MSSKTLFRVGDVSCYLRGRVWYLRYQEHGRRRQVRAGTDRDAVRRLAAEVNTQLAYGIAASTSFEPITIAQLRSGWLEHHENVLRSSVATISRYRTATRHLITFIEAGGVPQKVAPFTAVQAERFVHYLRSLEVSPNGHANASRRRLRDKGLKFVLEVCRTMFNFALKRRHLPPYANNPFTLIDIDRIPVEDAKPFVDLPTEKQCELLMACDEWAFPIIATLMLTGVRPGELTHLLVPDDLDLTGGWLHIRNKPELDWQVKTRNERSIPLHPQLILLLRKHVGIRRSGPLFTRRGVVCSGLPLTGRTRAALVAELNLRVEAAVQAVDQPPRLLRQRHAKNVWRDAGAVRPDKLREAFMKLTAQIGMPEVTTPKTLRHLFATTLQDANTDPLIRNQLMGHSAAGLPSASGGLGMTSVYTHTRPETLRRQLMEALQDHPAVHAIEDRLSRYAAQATRTQNGSSRCSIVAISGPNASDAIAV